MRFIDDANTKYFERLDGPGYFAGAVAPEVDKSSPSLFCVIQLLLPLISIKAEHGRHAFYRGRYIDNNTGVCKNCWPLDTAGQEA